LENIRQPLLWLFSGVLVGVGFVSVFAGGGFLLLAGLVVAGILFRRNRHHRRGWPALLYGAGIVVVLLLLPYIVRPSPCVAGVGAGCYQSFTTGTFAVAVIVAVAGIVLAVFQLRRGPRS
jgi:hypothetical protein